MRDTRYAGAEMTSATPQSTGAKKKLATRLLRMSAQHPSGATTDRAQYSTPVSATTASAAHHSTSASAAGTSTGSYRVAIARHMAANAHRPMDGPKWADVNWTTTAVRAGIRRRTSTADRAGATEPSASISRLGGASVDAASRASSSSE